MKRGDLVIVSLSGDYGKPCPALIIQSSLFDDLESVTVLPITSELRETPLFRITIKPTEENKLKKISQVMIDKAHTLPREKVSTAFGKLDEALLIFINRALALFLGFA